MSRTTLGLLSFQDWTYRSYMWRESSHKKNSCSSRFLCKGVALHHWDPVSALEMALPSQCCIFYSSGWPRNLHFNPLWESLSWEFCRLRAPDHVHPYSLLWPRRPSQTFNCEQLPLGAQAPGQWTDHRKRGRLTSDSRHCISHPQLWRMDRATEHPVKLSQLIQVPAGFTCTCGHSLKQRKEMSHGFLRPWVSGPTLGSPNHHALLGAAWGLTSVFIPRPFPGALDSHIHLSHLEKPLLTRVLSSPTHPVAPFRLREIFNPVFQWLLQNLWKTWRKKKSMTNKSGWTCQAQNILKTVTFSNFLLISYWFPWGRKKIHFLIIYHFLMLIKNELKIAKM